MAGMPDAMRQASKASAVAEDDPLREGPGWPGRGRPLGARADRSRSTRSTRTAAAVSRPPGPGPGHGSGQRPVHPGPPQRQAAPLEALDLHLGAEEELLEPGHHGVAEAGVRIEHETLRLRAGDPQQGAQLPVGLQQEGVRGVPDGQPGDVLAQLALEVGLGVVPAHGEDVAPEGRGAGPVPERGAPGPPPRWCPRRSGPPLMPGPPSGPPS